MEDLEKMLNKMIDDRGLREDFEKFKKENEGKSLEELLDELKEKIKKVENFKPDFKILVESDKEGMGRTVSVKGNKKSIMIGLAELATSLVQDSNLTEEDIRYAIETGIKTANEEE